jgi:dTDP-4-dehydrorhamnose 3,5-epimerase
MIGGLVVVENEQFCDERGSFERWWCEPTFQAMGLASGFTQLSLSKNPVAGTLRGLHLAFGAHAETKLIRCIRGAIFDVVADVRPDSPTFGRWQSYVLRGGEPRALHVGAGLAHGFLTLEAESEVLYLIDVPFRPEAARRISYRDERLAIDWPAAVRLISEQDREAADLASYLRELRCASS